MSKRFKIEFDSINDVPRVYVDGKRIDKLPTHGLQSLHLDWETNTFEPKPGTFDLKWYSSNDDDEAEINHISQTPFNRQKIQDDPDETIDETDLPTLFDKLFGDDDQ